MAKITDFDCADENDKTVPSDAFGNNIAFKCPQCGHPMLAIALENQRGSSPQHPAVCRSCHFRGWLSVDAAKRILRLHKAGSE